jgi:hypothetical protein
MNGRIYAAMVSPLPPALQPGIQEVRHSGRPQMVLALPPPSCLLPAGRLTIGRSLTSQCHLLCPELGMGAQSVGRTPWSARVPLDPLLAPPDQPHVTRERPTGESAADRGVRPTSGSL